MKSLMCLPVIIFLAIVVLCLFLVGAWGTGTNWGPSTETPAPIQTVNASWVQDYAISEAQISGNVARDEHSGVNLSEGTATFHVTVKFDPGAYSLRVYDSFYAGDTVQAVVNGGTPITVSLVNHFPGNYDKDVAIQLHSGDNTIVLSNQSGAGVDFCAHNTVNCDFVGGIIIYAGNPVH